MNHPEQVPMVAARLARDPRLAERLVLFYERLRALPRATRRALSRRLRLSLAATALLLALSQAPLGPPVHAGQSATIIVANNEAGQAANGICSFVEAINNANDKVDGIADGPGNSDCAPGNPAGADMIALPSGGTFAFSKSVSDVYGYTGLPPVTSTITIQGNNTTLTRSGANTLRFMTVAVSGDLTVNNLTMKGGNLPDYGGGALFVTDGKLTINNSTISGNESSAGGGVFAIYSDLVVNGTTVTGNSAYSGFSYGGGIYTLESNVTILNSTISGNEATNGNGGGVFANGGAVSINNLTAAENIASSGGGVMVYYGDGTISNSTFTGNKAVGDSVGKGGFGGGLNISESNVIVTNIAATDNTAYFGGGLATIGVGGEVTLDGAAISGNEASDDGGGVYVMDAILRMGKVTISDNAAESQGGGIMSRNGALTMSGSTVSGNSAGLNGGGIAVLPLQKAGAGVGSQEHRALEAVSTTLSNSTISGNSSGAMGGGLHNAAGTMTVLNATLTGNSATTNGGGVENAGGTLTMKRTLIAGNTAPTGREGHRQSGTVNVAAFNLFGLGGNAGLSGFAPGATDVVPGGSVLLASILGPLGGNGGPTLTHALTPNSPALDRAPSTDCNAAPINGVDQRGYPRNANAVGGVTANECDIGALETGFEVKVPVVLR